MAKLFQDIAKSESIKACLSSRPWVIFEDVFSDCPKLRLQNLTYHDIETYVNDRVRNNLEFQRLERNLGQSQQTSALVSEIVQMADGVFLWVQLVVDSLLR